MYDDSYIIKIWRVYKLDDQVTIMGGVYFDNNPVSNQYLNPSLPDSDRIGLSFGIEAHFLII